MRRAVPDANVLAAGFVQRDGLPAEVIDRWRGGEFEFAVSEHILGEVEHAWENPYYLSRFSVEQADRALALLRSRAIVTPISATVRGVASHEEDDLVLATAESAGADYLVTGDKALLALRSHKRPRILTPRKFLVALDRLRSEADDSR